MVKCSSSQLTMKLLPPRCPKTVCPMKDQITVGRTVGNNPKLSLGYNFTTFDDDLSKNQYDVNGWFLNIVGKY